MVLDVTRGRAQKCTEVELPDVRKGLLLVEAAHDENVLALRVAQCHMAVPRLWSWSLRRNLAAAVLLLRCVAGRLLGAAQLLPLAFF